MTNPFDNIDDAFSPMFMDTLSVNITRDNQQHVSTISCCMFPVEDEIPFDDIASHTDIKKMNILILLKDWDNNEILSSIIPEIGDKVITDDNNVWSIAQCERQFERWNIQVRSKS